MALKKFSFRKIQLIQVIDVTEQVVSQVLKSMGSSDNVNPEMVKDLVNEIVKQLSK